VAKLAFIFPGQGAQYPGMGKDFFENFSLARQTFEEADDLLERNLTKIIFNGPENVLTETQNSQVAIFVVSMAILRVLLQELTYLQPDVCAGLSLGEYTALAASLRLSFADGLKLVQHRGKFMNDACERNPGTMAVVLGLEAEQVEKLAIPNELWVANYNCPGQVVIAGTLKGVEKGSELARSMGAKRVLPLQVHGAFHSGLMEEAKMRLEPYILESQLKDSSIDFVMNVPGDFVKDLKQVKTHLINQVTHSVRWEQGVRRMSEKGVEHFFEIGCGKALTGFHKRIGIPGKITSIENVADLNKCMEGVV
jgi:[acyl-carrier-protein] S-malonyltransferase